MNKASISCLAKENGSSRIRLSSNSAIQDIIATNHVVLQKESHSSRLSRFCKGMAFIFLLALITVGIVILTVFLARARNALVATLTRSSESNKMLKPNQTRTIPIDHQNLTTIFNERKKDNWQTSTVTLTTDHFDQFTVENVHLSSTIMKTKQSSEQKTTMKPYPSSDTMVNEQSTTTNIVQTTNDDQRRHSTELATSARRETIMRKEVELTTTISMTSLPTTTSEASSTVFTTIGTESGRFFETSTLINNNISEISNANNSSSSSSSTIATTISNTKHDELTSTYVDVSSTNVFNQRFNWQLSTVSAIEDTTEQPTTITEASHISVKQNKIYETDDIFDEFLFS